MPPLSIDEAENKILNYLHEQKKEVDADTDLFESGAIDSMEMMALIEFIQDELKLQITHELFTADNFKTVKKMTRVLLNDQ